MNFYVEFCASKIKSTVLDFYHCVELLESRGLYWDFCLVK